MADATDPGQHVKITPPLKPEKSSGGAWFLLVLLIVVCAGAGYLTWPRWAPYVAAYLPEQLTVEFRDPRVGKLDSRVGDLESAAEALKQRDVVIATLEVERRKLSDSLSGVLARIESLEHSIGAVKEMARVAATAEEAAQASKSLKELNQRLTNLENAPAPVTSAAPTGGDDLELTQRLARLERDRSVAGELAKRIAELEAEGARSRHAREETAEKLTQSTANLSALADRLRAVEARPAATGGGAGSAIYLAVGELRDAVHWGRPFTEELAAAQAVADDDQGMKAALLTLAKHAESGVATLSVLRGEFAALASELAAAKTEPGGGWIDRAVERVGALVRFRRIDGAGDAMAPETIVAQTEKHLDGGDLGAAVKSAERLKTASAAAYEAAAPWLARAKARLAAEQSLATLHVHAVSLLSAGKE
ncbi:MAG: mitofilin family membrane protein [Rhodospirillaceae bacterium]